MDTLKLPKMPKGRKFEIYALGLRDFAGMRNSEQRLNPFELAQHAGLLVADFDQISKMLSGNTISQLLNKGKNDWSGGASSIALPDGKRLIILNPTMARKRQNATLMEEISHLFLGHKASRLAVTTTSNDGTARARDYHAEIEEEAYSVGAAALVPFESLETFVLTGKRSRDIARHFDVSYQLVEFRMKICGLWERYISIQSSKVGF